MSQRNGWVDVDIDGLRKLIEGRSKVFLLHELVSNAWDTDSKTVEVVIERFPGVPKAKVVVRDEHPEGFANLAHAYTLFAESEKKANAEKRGRFNMGEKLVLALCEEAKIETTTGSVVFDVHGRRTSKARTESGSVFEGTIRMTKDEHAEVVREFRKVIPPKGIRTMFNGEPLPERTPVAVITTALPTVIADDEGNLRRSVRKAVVEFYEPLPGEVASIYELGIPVVETGDRFHINVHQKVPLTMERDNVPPEYLKLVRALAVSELHERLTENDAKSVWVTQALTSEEITGDATRAIVTKRFGQNVVVYDPSDRESNHKAAAHDYNIVHGGALPAEAWENVRKAGAIKPAGQVFPTYSGFATATPAEVTPAMRRVSELAKDVARFCAGIEIAVRFIEAPDATTVADFEASAREMRFNVSKLGSEWFIWHGESDHLSEILDLIIHELGHYYEPSHLSARYHEAVTKLAGHLAVMALKKPGLFR